LKRIESNAWLSPGGLADAMKRDKRGADAA
jgi:hypothetical protein